MLGIELIDGNYNIDHWFALTKGLEKEPEKGKRCSVCFEERFEYSAKYAKEIGATYYTSTLLTSPKKSISQLTKIGDEIASKYQIEFLSVDYRKDGGTQAQFALAKQDKLYHQNFCGCIYALNMQRESQDKIADELFSPINNQVLPDSIEERIEIYTKRVEYEKDNIEYRLVRENFLNYRLLRGLVKYKKEPIYSYILNYSTLKRKRSVGKVDYIKDNIAYFNRDNIKLIDISSFNRLTNKNYYSIKELIYNPITLDEENLLRAEIDISFFSLSPIIVVDEIFDNKYEIFIDSIIYEDVKEILLKI
jgi:predicted adenine nucleotide alpha hydrolase (AANH) superfamily ATPase